MLASTAANSAPAEEAVKRCGLRQMILHHAFREGDRAINTVVALLARMGFKIDAASSSLMTCNDADRAY
ncbi:MAG: citrate lyase subunit alpha [Escherichia coli]